MRDVVRFAGGGADIGSYVGAGFGAGVATLTSNYVHRTAGTRLRIQASSPFLLHWTEDEWQNSTDMRSSSTAVGIEFVDLADELVGIAVAAIEVQHEGVGRRELTG